MIDDYTGETFELPPMPERGYYTAPLKDRHNLVMKKKGDPDIFEKYLAKTPDDWEIKRVPRPEGVAEWGEMEKTWEEKKALRERKTV
jgi:hypothetical protein